MTPSLELSVVVPCLNEALNLVELTTRVLDTFARGDIRGELILVDDGSTDDTDAVLRQLEAAHPNRVVGIRHPENRGIAAAWYTGALASRGRLVAVMDADLQYQPEDLLRLRRRLYESSVDVVQGWRSPVGRLRDRRYTLSRGFNHLLNGVFGMRLRDNKSGFVMCAREVFLDLLRHRGRYAYWQSFIMVAAHAKGYSYEEVETLFQPRRQGESFLDHTAIRASLRSVVDLGRAAVEYRVGRPSREPTARPTSRRAPSEIPPPDAHAMDPLGLRARVYLRTFDVTHFMMTRAVEQKLDALRRTERASAAELRALQDERLRRLVRHAYRNVPFYRARMQAVGLRPEEFRGLDDLGRLPITTRQDIERNLYFDVMSDGHDKDQVLEVRGVGRDLAPFTRYVDREQLEFRWAAGARARAWTGHRLGERWVRLGHPPAGVGAARSVRERVDSLLGGRSLLSVSLLTPARVRELVERMLELDPTLIDGDAEALAFLAPHVLARTGAGARSRGPRPRAVLSGGQRLGDAERRAVERAFGCPVFDQYSSAEFSVIAHECEEHTGLHVASEGYVVEILVGDRPARAGEVGDVVITDLNNRCLPFLRYAIGDRARAVDDVGGAARAACPCGRHSPRLSDLHGATPLVVQSESGHALLGGFVAHSIKDLGYAIKRCRVEPLGPRELRLWITRGGRYSEDVVRGLVATLERHLGGEVRVSVELEGAT